jgi:hypothetical protein
MIENYLEQLGRELDFDRSLSRCVRQEVEDHLWEAVAASRSGNSHEAERQAVANFGDARAIAAEFAVVSLARHTRRAGIAAVLIIVSVFIAMKARVAWYAAMQLAISDDLRAAGRIVMTIDRYAFLLSLGSVAGFTSGAARFLRRSIRPIVGSFVASFCYAAQPRRRWSFPSSAMRC